MTQHKSKFRPPVFTRQPGFKNQTHDAGWIASIVAALKAGTGAALTRFRQPVNYRGVPPNFQPSDVSAPIEARPSSEIAEISDVPMADTATADLTRKLDGKSVPLHPAFMRQTKR